MKKRLNNKTILIIFLFILVATILVGYASVTGINLSITGHSEVKGVTDAEDFKVKFIGTPEKFTTADSIKVDANVVDDHNANFTVTDLLGYGDTVTIKYQIKNESNYFSSKFTVNVNNTNETYFLVEKSIINDKNEEIITLDPGKTATLVLKGKVIKVPTDAAQQATVTVTISAESEAYMGAS